MYFYYLWENLYDNDNMLHYTTHFDITIFETGISSPQISFVLVSKQLNVKSFMLLFRSINLMIDQTILPLRAIT